MTIHGYPKRVIILRVAAVLLCILGIAAAYFWFYRLGPIRRFHDPAWYSQHSWSACWKQSQKSIDRSGWSHSTMVGPCGDKQWAEWIMNHIARGDDISSCAGGHKDSALRRMTNQDAGDTAKEWLDWWNQNESKSQEEWIRDGFRSHGIDLQAPLTRSNVVSLLKITAYRDQEECGVPGYVQYNAFRWLRDSDFDPHTFSVDDLQTEDGNEVLDGLIRLADRAGMFPKNDRIGVLNIGQPPDDLPTPPAMAEAKFRVMAHVIVFAPICIGCLLFSMSCRIAGKNKTVEQPDRTRLR